MMLCAVHNLTFRVEDRLAPPEAESATSSDLSEQVSTGSRTDYICYTVEDGVRMTAVVLETKVLYHPNACAQLLGYYIRACANILKPGVCVLLTADKMYIMLFPFCNNRKNPLINALCLKPIQYTDNLELSLKLLTVVTNDSFKKCQVMLESKFLPIEKGHCFKISTAQDLKLKQLEKELESMKKKYTELQQEVIKLRCVTVPVTVNLDYKIY